MADEECLKAVEDALARANKAALIAAEIKMVESDCAAGVPVNAIVRRIEARRQWVSVRKQLPDLVGGGMNDDDWERAHEIFEEPNSDLGSIVRGVKERREPKAAADSTDRSTSPP